jgi:hypothetical protein
MPLQPSRVLRIPRYAVLCNGVDAYVVVEPFVVYGWNEITIEAMMYIYHSKPTATWSYTNMIGDVWSNEPFTFIRIDPYFTTPFLNFVTRRPDGSLRWYGYNISSWINAWIHLVARFTPDRVFDVWVNGEVRYSVTIPVEEVTVLEWDPGKATNPDRYKRFVLGTGTRFDVKTFTHVSYGYLRIYSKALIDDEILWNFLYPWSPVRSGLALWLMAHPDYVKDIDGDGVLEWVDLSGYGNHGKIYGARLVELIRAPAR